MPDSIDRLSGTLEILRRQIAESARRLDIQGKPSTAAAKPTAPGSKPPLQEVKRRIKERLGAISKDDPNRAKKSQRVFIESVLAWEFGDALLLDKRFDELLDKIQEGMNAVPDINQRFDKFLTSIEQS